MADVEPLSIRGVHWRDALPVTNLFRAFRVAIHPSKLLLALAALLLLYAGGHVLDVCWPAADRAVPDEVGLYEQFADRHAPDAAFADVRRTAREQAESSYADLALALGVAHDRPAALAAAHSADRLGEVKDALVRRRDDAVAEAGRDRDAQLRGAPSPATRRDAEAVYRSSVRTAFDRASAAYRSAKQVRGEGLFDAFFEYESNQVSSLVQGVREWNWFGSPAATAAAAGVDRFALPWMANGSVPTGMALPVVPSTGVLPAVERFFAVGPVWLLTQHWVYFTLFAAGFLVIWSVFGGAIARIAAVHVARDEKLSIRSALVFSIGKFLSFLCAPLIPLGILALVGLVLSAAALLGNVPWVGPIALGAGFVLALLAGLVMAGVLVGLVGGFNLMYPTVAVEGSDSFDAISRSFSYLYARPWRLAFYTAVSLVYGSACYLFVRLFIYLVLLLTHKFVALGLFTHANSTAPLLSALWPDPSTAGRLTYNVDSLSLTFPQEVAAALIWFWVHMVIAVLGAFVVTFYFSSNTIIYYLLRQEVDATDLNEVYVDPSDEDDQDEPDPADPVPAPATAAASPPVTMPTADGADPAPPT